MHRVELKDSLWAGCLATKAVVPNAPCGVESVMFNFFLLSGNVVPNAPCGVESGDRDTKLLLLIEFLMHRVELKEPCGFS